MVGVLQITPGLKKSQLIQEIRENTIRFGSETSAAYHICKHQCQPQAEYIYLVNQLIRHETSSIKCSVSQEGDSRFVHFENESGSVVVMEKDSKIILLSAFLRQKYVKTHLRVDSVQM